MKVLILACFIAAASALPRNPLGSEKCTWGPAYWCKNYQQATECNALEHCKRNVWKSNDLCSDCKSVVTEIHNYVVNNGSEIIALMNLLCVQLGSMADECKVVVDLYGKTILQTVAKLTADSAKLCQEVGLCPATMKEVRHTIMKVIVKQLKSNPTIKNLKSVKADYCEDCKLVFGEIKDVLKDKDLQKDLIGIVEKFCAELGSFGTKCKSFVDLYGPFVLQEISSLIDPASICAEIGLCNSTKKVVSAILLKPAAKMTRTLFFPMAPGLVLIGAEKPAKAKPVDTPKVSVECVVCEFMMRELDGILGENATKEEIEKALDKVCSILPSTVRSECQALVNEYGPLIIKLLLQELQPSEICTELGLCSSGKKLLRVSLHKKINGGECELCKLVIQYAESALRKNATEEEIKEALDDACNSLPSELKTECLAVVNEYLDTIIKLILQKLTPEDICKEIGLCTAGVNGYVKNKCFLGESYWCANYKNALKCECLMVARKLRKEKVGEAYMIHKILCKVLKFYEYTESQVTEGAVKDKLCQQCKNDVNYLGNLFPKNTSKDEILNGLKAVCSRFLDHDVVDACNNIIKHYGDFIVKLLKGEIDAETFCEKLGLCKRNKNAWVNMKCYLGKSYWCASYNNALECQALEHCRIPI